MVHRSETDALRARFARQGIHRCRRGAAVFCAFAAAMLLASAASSLYYEPFASGELLRIRSITLATIALIGVTLAMPLGARRPRELALLAVVTISLCICALAEDTGGQFSPQYDRLTLVVLGVAILMSWNAGWSLLACAAAVAVFAISSVASGGVHTPQFAVNLGRLLVACVVTVGANIARERARWRELWHSHTMAVARQRADAEIRRLNEELEQRVLDRTAALRASEERFRAMFEAAPVGVITIDAGGQLLQTNPAFAAMLAVDGRELRASRLDDYIAAEFRERIEDDLAALRDGVLTAVQLEVELHRQDGTAVAAHGALAAIRDEANRFLYAIGMVEDVTDQRRAEEQVREHQEQLAHVLRVATMGGMVAELAHELNQPLGAIVNFANGTSARLRRSGADPAVAEAVARIAAEGMRAAEILRRVREFVRPGGVPTEQVDLNGLVKESAQLIESDAQRHRIPLRLRLDPALPTVRLDRIHVEQVLLNLLRNAIDAMRAAPERDHELVVQTVARVGAGVEVHVRDTGVGLPGGASDRIFDAFFTTKPGGLGMGLSISRSIVEAYGGRLWASGNADRGATVAFSFPEAERETPLHTARE